MSQKFLLGLPQAFLPQLSGSCLSANPTGMSIIIPTGLVLLVHLSSLSMSLCLSLTTLFIQCVRLATHLKDKQTAWPRDKGLTARTHVTENLFTVFPQKRERGGRRGQWEEGCDVYSEIVTTFVFCSRDQSPLGSDPSMPGTDGIGVKSVLSVRRCPLLAMQRGKRDRRRERH
ncbi:unnamed protein product [Leuciscus chuanchicus]